MHVYPNTNLTIPSANKGVSFQRTEDTATEFQDLKQAITGPDVMLFHSAQFELHVDAGKLGCGAMLAHKKDGIIRPVRFASRAFTPAESRWTTLHEKLFAIARKFERVITRQCSFNRDR